MAVNGTRPPPAGMLIDPELDRVTVGGRRVGPRSGFGYVMLNKPEGVLVSAHDPQGRPTVQELLGDEASGGRRLFSVGRLDLDSRGLLLLTDNGPLAHRLTHASFAVSKEYLATVSGIPGEAALARLRGGVALDDGLTQPARVELLETGPGPRARVRIVIREGRNRQVRRMFEGVGHPVRDLLRTGFGPLHLGRLKSGMWRRLRPAEIEALGRVGT